jgi:hypothetical protein
MKSNIESKRNYSFSAVNHVVGFNLSHEIVSLLSEHHRVLIGCKSTNSVDLSHDLLVSSLLGKAFKELHLGISLQLNSLSDHWSHLLLSFGNYGLSVGISFSDCLGSIGLSLLNNLGLNQLGFSNDLIVFKISLSIDLVDQGIGLSLPFRLDS